MLLLSLLLFLLKRLSTVVHGDVVVVVVVDVAAFIDIVVCFLAIALRVCLHSGGCCRGPSAACFPMRIDTTTV